MDDLLLVRAARRKDRARFRKNLRRGRLLLRRPRRARTRARAAHRGAASTPCAPLCPSPILSVYVSSLLSTHLDSDSVSEGATSLFCRGSKFIAASSLR